MGILWTYIGEGKNTDYAIGDDAVEEYVEALKNLLVLDAKKYMSKKCGATM
jgi:hypothetical protein